MNHSDPGAKVMQKSALPVRIGQIDHGLAELWSQFNQDIGGGQAVMRACMSNLIIYCDRPEDAELIGKEIKAIVNIHPARVLLLTGHGCNQSASLEARVSIYFDTLADGWQVCAERIDVVSTSDSIARLPSVARSKLIGDLPISLWWASTVSPLDAGDVFIQLSALANQVIYDNIGWTNPAKHVASMTRWIAGQQDTKVFFNLSWRRIGIWRKLISQVLDPMVNPDALPLLTRIEIHHGPHNLPPTWLLIGWLAYQLNWKPVAGKRLSDSELVWRFENGRNTINISVRRIPDGEPLIYRLLFDWSQSRQDGRVCFEYVAKNRIGIIESESTVPPRVFVAETTPTSGLVAAQLAYRSRDKLFENALKLSNRMTSFF